MSESKSSSVAIKSEPIDDDLCIEDVVPGVKQHKFGVRASSSKSSSSSSSKSSSSSSSFASPTKFKLPISGGRSAAGVPLSQLGGVTAAGGKNMRVIRLPAGAKGGEALKAALAAAGGGGGGSKKVVIKMKSPLNAKNPVDIQRLVQETIGGEPIHCFFCCSLTIGRRNAKLA